MIYLISGCSPLENLSKERDLDELLRLEEMARKNILGTLKEGLPYRLDGYSYAVDLGNILRAAAVARDEILFEIAFERFRQFFLVNPSDGWEKGQTVVWRTIDGTNRDATGSAETINAADAFWIAFERWGKEEYKILAHDLAQSYLHHGSWIEGNRFFVKNYYNYVTKTLSENTWLLNQRPDVLLRIGEGMNDTSMVRYAHGMARFCRAALFSNGFSREIFDPGIGTVISGATGYYSPDGYYATLTTLDVNYALIPFDREPARVLLNWLSARLPNLRKFYFYNINTKEFEETEYEIIGLVSRSRILQIILELQRYQYSRPGLLDYFIGWHFTHHVRDYLTRPRFSTYFFEVPLAIEAIQELHQRKK